MTVLVGVRCEDGVVIGSDSAKTSADGSGRLTTSTPGSKIDIIGGKVVIAHTGQVGMGQRFADTMARSWEAGNFKGKNSLDFGRLMAQTGAHDFAGTNANPGQYGALVGYRTQKDGPSLCELAIADFQPEVKTDIWYCSMGSGQSVVDPLLALFRKAFWNDGPPNLAGGLLATTWALELAIELCPFGVDGPIRVAVCDKNGNAKFVEDNELDEHRENAKQAVEHFGRYAAILDDIESAPDVPKPD